jgi:hypothetical protein
VRHRHLLMCAVLAVVAIVVVTVGVGSAAFLPVIGCMAMMIAMMWGMAHLGRGAGH